MEFNINGFISKNNPEKSICREERQYAALLYELILRARSDNSQEYSAITDKILKKGAKIIHVYFEATLMRDYFVRCKTQQENKYYFNNSLIRFCFKKYNTDAEEVVSEFKRETFSSEPVNLGGSYQKLKDYIKQNSRYREQLYLARCMMNATPDLMVIYKDGNDICAKAIECKYLSDESKYDFGLTQCGVQREIMKFLFGDEGIITFDGSKIRNDQVIRVDFKERRRKNDSGETPVAVINKEELIKLIYKISDPQA